MKQLKSITLSNIRRFGADAKIELSSGVTILLAPNGTGKTAVFEAIEFGLTGKISRLGENLSPIIRENQNFAEVSLNFDEIKLSSKVDSGGNVERKGDLNTVFPETPEEDIPFLLRLTHLLDQREGEWLVKAEAKAAGAQLARLPIGKDGSQVNSSLIGVRRAISEKIRVAEKTLIKLADELQEWQKLVQERDSATSYARERLRSKEQIFDSIYRIIGRSESSELIPKNLATSPANSDDLMVLHGAIEEIIQNKLERLCEQTAIVNEVDGIVHTFEEEEKRLKRIESEFYTVKNEYETKREQYAAKTKEIEKLQDELAIAEKERYDISQKIEKFLNKKKANEFFASCSEQLKTTEVALATALSDLQTSQINFQAHEELNAQHNLIRKQRQELAQKEAELANAHDLLERWATTLQELKDLDGLLNEQKAEELDLRARLKIAISVRTRAEDEKRVAKSHHEALSMAEDFIKQAVASIAINLSDVRDDCPVCGEIHGAVELQKRIAVAMSAMDPNVVEAEQELKNRITIYNRSEMNVKELEAKIEEKMEKLDSIGIQKDRLTANISAFINNPLFLGDSIEAANESIMSQEESIILAKRQLDERLQELATPVDRELYENSKSAYESALRALDLAEQRHSDASRKAEQAKAELATIPGDLQPALTLDELCGVENQIVSKIDSLKEILKTESFAEEKQKVQISIETERLALLEKHMSAANSRLISIRNSWFHQDFTGDPKAESVSHRKTELRQKLDKLNHNLDELRAIKIEIGAWGKSEQLRFAQSLLDRRRGELSEEEFVANYRNDIEENKTLLSCLNKLYEAMHILSNSLSEEIKNVQKHVRAVLPRWQALLKRVVREQRFAETNLSFRSSYGKEKAEVSLSLHGEEVPVPFIASEAQLTDLQLTFLLSMALEHSWTPWRCLLLDDPTQHHDMVHAASVFDVLRDYAVDHGFQIIIATHDALQARYFMRKLKNDGIDAQIWSLAPSAEGVTATAS